MEFNPNHKFALFLSSVTRNLFYLRPWRGRVVEAEVDADADGLFDAREDGLAPDFAGALPSKRLK